MENTVKERVKHFIKCRKISIREFERSCGLSNGYVNGISSTIMPNKLSMISRQFPDLNIGWILTGEGNMLKSKFGNEETSDCGNGIFIPNDIIEQISKLTEVVLSQQKVIESLTNKSKNA